MLAQSEALNAADKEIMKGAVAEFEQAIAADGKQDALSRLAKLRQLVETPPPAGFSLWNRDPWRFLEVLLWGLAGVLVNKIIITSWYLRSQRFYHEGIVMHIGHIVTTPLLVLIAIVLLSLVTFTFTLANSNEGSLALIVPPQATKLDAKHAVWLDEFNSNDLAGLLVQKDANGEVVGGYLVGQVAGDVNVLKAALDQVLPSLRERLIGPLAARLVDLGFRQATLIPGGLLSLLPLHAAAFERMTVTYAPSARALQVACNAAKERIHLPPVLLGIGNPLPNPQPLAFARAEVEAIAPLFAPEKRRAIYERQANRKDTLKHLPGATHLHFSCHGAFNTEKPLDSALYLSGADRLTLHDLLDGDLDLSAARLAVLSACQTGITDFGKVPDEAIGLPSGFLQAGVPGVVSTLWPVNDVSTALLMECFYRHHLRDGLDAATAPRQAQAWLRNAKAGDLAEFFEAEMHKPDTERFLPYDQASDAWQRFTYDFDEDDHLYAHPVYWAAFIFSGA